MTILNRTFGQHPLPKPKLVLLLIAVLGTAVAIGVITAVQSLILVIGAVVAVLLLFVAMVWPEALTLVVMFILYTNAAVVAVQFHGVPFLVGASVTALLIIPLANYLIIRRQKLIFHPLLPLLVLFLVIQMLGALRAEEPDEAMLRLATYATEGLALFFLITNVVRIPETLRRVIWVLLLAGALLGGLTFYQQVTQTYDKNYGGFAQVSNAAFGTGEEKLQGEVEQPRLAGPFGGQNFYAQMMLMLVPLGVFRFWDERSNLLRFLALTATGLILIGATLTFSRGGAVGLVLMIVIMAFMRYIKLYQLAIIVLGLVLVMQAFPQYGTRLTSLEALTGAVADDGSTGIEGADSAIRSRLTEMGAAGLVFVDHPVIGVGPGMFKYYYRDYAELIGLRVQMGPRQAHNLYLDIAAENGASGLICFLAILTVTLVNLARIRKRWIQSRPEFASMATGFILAIVSYMATGMFLSFGFERYFWLIIALSSAMMPMAAEMGVTSTLASAETEPTRKSVGRITSL